MLSGPITARLRITEPMPIRLLSPMVQPCSITRWPTVTPWPMCIGTPSSVCSTLPSWMLLFSPMWIGSLSPRRVAFHQIDAPADRCTSPITVALGAIQAVLAMVGLFAPRR